MTAISARPTATPEPLSVWTRRLPLPLLAALKRAPACGGPGNRRRPSRTKSRGRSPAPAARPRCRRSSARRSPCRRSTASSRGSGGRGGFSTSSAQASMRSCSSRLCSGVVIDTSSTLSNWCWRSMPRVSRPAAPGLGAEARRQRGEAERQLGLVEDGFADEVGQRDFGGGDEPETLGADASAQSLVCD